MLDLATLGARIRDSFDRRNLRVEIIELLAVCTFGIRHVLGESLFLRAAAEECHNCTLRLTHASPTRLVNDGFTLRQVLLVFMEHP